MLNRIACQNLAPDYANKQFLRAAPGWPFLRSGMTNDQNN